MEDSTSTREKLLQAAVRLLGESGVQSITHRNVEEAAGVARGSTRYHFGSREDLLASVLEYMAHASNSVIEQAAGAVEGASLDPGEMSDHAQAQAMAAMAAGFLADPANELARFELFLYATRRPELRETLAHWRNSYIDFSAQHLAACGAIHPEATARLCVAAMDGMILHALTVPHEDFQRFGPAWMAMLAETAVTFDPSSSSAP